MQNLRTVRLLNRDFNRKFVASVYTHAEAHGRRYCAGYANLQDIRNVRRAYNEHTTASVQALIFTGVLISP